MAEKPQDVEIKTENDMEEIIKMFGNLYTEDCDKFVEEINKGKEKSIKEEKVQPESDVFKCLDIVKCHVEAQDKKIEELNQKLAKAYIVNKNLVELLGESKQTIMERLTNLCSNITCSDKPTADPELEKKLLEFKHFHQIVTIPGPDLKFNVKENHLYVEWGSEQVRLTNKTDYTQFLQGNSIKVTKDRPPLLRALGIKK